VSLHFLSPPYFAHAILLARMGASNTYGFPYIQYSVCPKRAAVSMLCIINREYPLGRSLNIVSIVDNQKASQNLYCQLPHL
jgi:hypothetical protein